MKEISGPSIFTKGLLKYKQGRFEDSKKLILKAGKWMRALKSDDFYKATMLVVESKLGQNFENNIFKDALDSIKNSPYKGTNDYAVIIEHLKEKYNNEHITFWFTGAQQPAPREQRVSQSERRRIN